VNSEKDYPRSNTPAEEHLREQREEIAAETRAMASAYNALQDTLAGYARERVLDWLAKVLDTRPDPPF
jgi:hypothetical protein